VLLAAGAHFDHKCPHQEATLPLGVAQSAVSIPRFANVAATATCTWPKARSMIASARSKRSHCHPAPHNTIVGIPRLVSQQCHCINVFLAEGPLLERQCPPQEVILPLGIAQSAVGNPEVCQDNRYLDMLRAEGTLFDRQRPFQVVTPSLGATQSAAGIPKASKRYRYLDVPRAEDTQR